MRELPTGTVSMLFSDIEGSTLLLSRLGHRYADVLDSHRRVLRAAWAAHEGTELGTEGDSFFVVFPTAEGAVSAAVQADRGLEDYPWPGGEQVRVRIGIHTGSPQVHDDDYVGMDVHRAARIAGSAHGGQVVLSSATADLARDGLPEGVGLRDLGSYRLKDLPAAEHLFQLTIEGLRTDFPDLKTLGASASLPVPATPLVGRDREVTEATSLVRSSGVRLVTLTGPGGSGKTRLAIEVARGVVASFPDGVFFVPLASATSADVMWTSIAEVLDVPPRDRMPPRIFQHLAHRTALLVLDNLEHLPGADDVVTQLLAAAPHCTVVASSRRALSVPGEHRYPVRPLALPDDTTLARAERAGAVQLFVQHARSMDPDFRLTAENVADVVAICRRLDGLPLAIELSAARVRLLSPRALLGRIDQALDVASTSRQVPGRQRSLRDTIAWSYHLLSEGQKRFYRRLGVFAGGAGLDAVAAVTDLPADADSSADLLDMVADLVDASLVTVTEGPNGEPRLAMLETVRAYARRELRATVESEDARSAHARHYLEVAEQLKALRESQHLVALGLAEAELDNFREALGWALQQDRPDQGAGRWDARIALQLCASLSWLWHTGGYVAEGRRWFEQAIEGAGGSPSRDLADCLGGYANLLVAQGESERACDFAAKSLAMARALGEGQRAAYALGVLGTAQLQRGNTDTARQTLQEALDQQRRMENPGRLARALGNLAGIEEMLGHYERAEELTHEALAIVQELGDTHEAAVQGQNLANLLAIAGRVDEAHHLAQSLVATVLGLRSPDLIMAFANTCMNILIRLGEPVRAAHLLGAEEAMRERLSMPNPHQQEEREEAWTLVKERISVEDWQHHCQLGQGESVEDLLARLSNG